MRRATKLLSCLPPPAELDKVPFGSLFATFMIKREYRAGSGWLESEVVPFGNLSLPPQCAALHYGTQCFEGTKAYRGPDGRVRLFRPQRNAERMASSMERLGMPRLPVEDFCDAVRTFVRRNEAWVPPTVGHSLYIRPCAVGTNETLRVGPPDRALFFVVGSPVGTYYPEGVKPVSLYVEEKLRRAWPGGTGRYKLGANYAPTVLPQATVAQQGYAQCLWLGEGDALQEVGAMNIMVVLREGGETALVTPPLDGTILEGVTRSCIMELAGSYEGVSVCERALTIHDVLRAKADGSLLEMFGCGTAAIVSPVKCFSYRGEVTPVPVPEGGIAMRVRRDLLNIQHGVTTSPWSEVLSKDV